MNRPVHRFAAAPKTIATYDSASLQARLGPAEAQYGDQVIVASLEGAQGPLACGTTIVDGDANDTSSSPQSVGVNLVWTDINGETGYRWQVDAYSATFVSEDLYSELPPNYLGPSGVSTGFGINPTSVTHTFRVFGHVGHAPDHGPTPIAGDVVSNECTVTFFSPGVPQAPTN